MKYIVATSDTTYFRWQILVQINNFKSLNMLDDLVYVVSINKKRSVELNRIEKETGVKIFTYKDERNYKSYTSSIRPHVMKKFLSDNPEYGKLFFYLDPDVIFVKKPEYSNEILTNNDWYVSDTKSYLDSKYIKSKGLPLFYNMCKIIDIDPNIVEKNDNDAGGAQYIMKNIDSSYWENVEKDCEKLYSYLVSTSKTYNPQHPIQFWTTDMWVVLWNAWKRKFKTNIIDELDFSWATDSIDRWDKRLIHHNAGVFGQDYLFNKGNFSNKHPFNEDFSNVSPDYCSFNYVNEILKTKMNYSELINKI